MIKAIILAVFVLPHSIASAETFQGIGPHQTLGDIKAKFPNAVVVPIKAAWVTENDAFYSLSGDGFPGTLFIAFTDSRPLYRIKADEAKANALDDEHLRTLANKSNDEALLIRAMRWMPATPIPIQRYVSKYGKLPKVEFSAQDMTPHYRFPDMGLLLNVSDDQKLVISVEFTFTEKEERDSCPLKYDASICKQVYK